MQHTAYQARLDKPLPDGTTTRAAYAFLLTKARRQHGDDSPQVAAALARLDGPARPECLSYLESWSRALHGRSGVGMDGPAPLSPPVIESWARLTGRRVRPHEVEALLTLDTVRRNPPDEDVI
jgi:hypothetical protein